MKKSEKTFEERMTELEELIEKLESGSVPLEEMVTLHERGMALYDSCAKELAAFEKRLKAPGADQ
jgi:exodeoxyribonuclease VII small subunit